MLIKFETNSYPDIIMFGEIGKKLIKFTGHSGTIPSAINAKDVSAALHSMQLAIKNEMDSLDIEEDLNEDNEEYVSIEKRAIPLIELFESAVKNEEGVMWDFA